MATPNKVQTFTATEVATYVVCPESWRLKQIHKVRKPSEEKELASVEERKSWLQSQNVSAELRHYAKIAYLLLFLIVVTVFMMDHKRAFKFRKHFRSSQKVEQPIKPKELKPAVASQPVTDLVPQR